MEHVVILPHKSVEEYVADTIKPDGIDQVDDIDYMGEYKVGGNYQGAIIVGIFKHNESCSAWMVIMNQQNALFEIAIDWSDTYGVYCQNTDR